MVVLVGIARASTPLSMTVTLRLRSVSAGCRAKSRSEKLYMAQEREWDLIVPSHAKINIGLYVLGKRPDGYHDIWTIFQELEFHDTLYFRKQTACSTITTSHPDLPTGQENLVHQALQSLRNSTGFLEHVGIHLEKRLPLSSGLGGGSSNAAATLRGLNRLLNLNCSPEHLHTLAAELGSDVPFFLSGGTALGTGRGEIIHPIEDFPILWVVLVNPGISVSSGWAYKNVNLKLTNPEGLIRLPPDLREVVITGVHRFSFRNMLEPPVIRQHPIIGSIKSDLMEYGAEWAMMSGSGATVFGVFGSQERAMQALHRMTQPGWVTVVTSFKQRKSIF